MPGNVQVPADGQPIVLLKEQTIGGYTNIATVISPDIFRMAQAGPGDTVQFIHVTLDEAHQIYRDWIRFLNETEVLLTDDQQPCFNRPVKFFSESFLSDSLAVLSQTPPFWESGKLPYCRGRIG